MKVTTPKELVSDKRKQTRHISREDKAKQEARRTFLSAIGSYKLEMLEQAAGFLLLKEAAKMKREKKNRTVESKTRGKAAWGFTEGRETFGIERFQKWYSVHIIPARFQETKLSKVTAGLCVFTGSESKKK